MVTIPDKNIRLPNLQEMATLPLSQVVFLNAQIQYFRDSRNDIQLPRRQSPGAKGKKSERLCHLPIVELHETQSRPSAWSQKRKQCAIVPKVLKCSDSVLKPDQSSQVRTRKALPLLQNRRGCLLNITYQNSTRKWKFLFAHSTSWTEGLMLSAIADQQLVPPNAGIANKQIISFLLQSACSARFSYFKNDYSQGRAMILTGVILWQRLWGFGIAWDRVRRTTNWIVLLYLMCMGAAWMAKYYSIRNCTISAAKIWSWGHGLV